MSRRATSTRTRQADVEDESTFADFLAFLVEAAVRHPEELGNVVELTDRYAHLVEGVDLEE